MKKEFAFILKPREKKQYVAGPYDPVADQPRYEMSFSAPEHVRGHVLANQFLHETGDGFYWAWNFENPSDSQFMVLVMVKKDGQ